MTFVGRQCEVVAAFRAVVGIGLSWQDALRSIGPAAARIIPLQQWIQRSGGKVQDWQVKFEACNTQLNGTTVERQLMVDKILVNWVLRNIR